MVYEGCVNNMKTNLNQTVFNTFLILFFQVYKIYNFTITKNLIKYISKKCLRIIFLSSTFFFSYL